MIDCIIIGAGPGGYETALYAAKKGLNVTLIEKEALGGTCLNKGCIPTKTLLYASEKMSDAKLDELGIQASKTIDLTQLQTYKNQIIAQLQKGIAASLKKAHVQVIMKEAKIMDEHHVRVEDEILEAKNIIIATGSKSIRPSFMPDLKGVMTSDELLNNDKPIQHLVIIGGGVIGVEFASIYHNLNTKVTILEAKEQLLPNMDKEIAQNLKMIFKKRGIEVHTSAFVTKIEEGLNVSFMEKEALQTIACDALLVAVGRSACSDHLFEDESPLMDKGRILVNEAYQTSWPSVYAIGDVNGQLQLAHAAVAQGKNVIHHILNEKMPYDLSNTPNCVYCEPEIAAVGLSESEAKALGYEVKVSKGLTSANGKSVLSQQDRGFVKLISDAKTQKLLGAQLMCARASDLVSELTLAIQCELTLEQIAHIIYPHPTISEVIQAASEN